MAFRIRPVFIRWFLAPPLMLLSVLEVAQRKQKQLNFFYIFHNIKDIHTKHLCANIVQIGVNVGYG